MADELGVVPGPQVEIFLQHDALCRVPGLLGFGDMHVRLACRTHEVLTIAAAEGYRPCEYIGLRKCTGGQAMPSVLVTGANRGLGFEFARQFAAEGWRVFATCRHPDSATALHRLNGAVGIIALDVTDGTSIRDAAMLIEEPVDLLINSAGIIGPPDRAGKTDYEAWREVIEVNTMGPLRVVEAFITHLVRSERKVVVTITSGMGSIGDNTSGGSIPYRSSKAAVNMVMRTLPSIWPVAASFLW